MFHQFYFFDTFELIIPEFSTHRTQSRYTVLMWKNEPYNIFWALKKYKKLKRMKKIRTKTTTTRTAA